MGNLNINLNLLNLKNAGIASLNGKIGTKRCLVIPIEDNDLHEGEKGIYLNLAVWSNDKLKDGKTHLVKQSFSKEARERMSNEELKQMPILGNAKPFGEAKAQAQEYTQSADNSFTPDDDLPF